MEIELIKFLDKLAWFLGIPSSIMFVIKCSQGYKEFTNKEKDYILVPVFYFLCPALCFAWILR